MCEEIEITNNTYKQKYLKYKQKYLDIQNGGKTNKFKFILIDGTSSSGKSTICKHYYKKGFIWFAIDDYFLDERVKFFNLFKKIENKYGETNKIYDYETVKYMVDDSINIKSNIIFDHVFQSGIIKRMKEKNLSDNLYIINVYTNLKNLSLNIESRRKKGDTRSPINVFKQFSERYIACNNNDKNKIELVNRIEFKKILLNNFKYEFINEDDLIKFTNYIFFLMNINDDDDHYVKLRKEYKCDYLLNTTNKSIKQIYEELDNVIL
jgi:adenylate kinase family enzyme